MSGTKETPGKPPADEPPVHVDTEEQAAARQLIETSQRVTHVAPPEPPPSDDADDFSLAVLVKPVVVVSKGKPPAHTASHSDKDKK